MLLFVVMTRVVIIAHSEVDHGSHRCITWFHRYTNRFQGKRTFDGMHKA